MLSLLRDAHWTWGPARRYPEPDGYYQYQHMTIKVYEDLYLPDIDNPSIDKTLLCEVKIRELVRDVNDLGLILLLSPVDIHIDLVSFEIFTGFVKPSGILFLAAAHEIRYLYLDFKRQELRIHDDTSLASAIAMLRTKAELSVSVGVFDKHVNKVI
jgi:hypothetical protein